MNCREVRRLLYLSREGELPYDTLRELQQHMVSCGPCSLEMQQDRDAEKIIADLRGMEPRLHAQRDLTDRVMRAIESDRAGEPRSRPQDVALSFRRLQFSCTLAAVLIAVTFFIQNGIDAYRVARLESRLDRYPTAFAVSRAEPPLAALGFNTIAELGRVITGPPAPSGTALRGRLQVKNAVRSFFDAVREGPPGYAGEVQRLRMKYPEVWFISPLHGLSDEDRQVLDRDGKALMRDLRTLLQRGKN